MDSDGTVRSFAVTMRGYDRQEVDEHLRRTATSFAELRERVAELEEQLVAARSGSRPDDPTDAPASERFEALGAEAARILTAAEESAREMRDRAATRATAEADAAERAARERVATASAHAAQLVGEAERRREEVLTEVDERRRAVELEIAHLRDVRDRMVAALRGAVAATTDTVAELRRVEPAAANPADGPDDEHGQGAADAPDNVEEPTTRAEPAGGDEPGDGDESAGGDDGATARPASGVATVPAADGHPVDSTSADLRTRAVAQVRPGVLRRLRRALQDLQHEVLRAVRERDGDDAGTLLPADGAAAPLTELSLPYLRDCHDAGVVDAAALVSGHPPDLDDDGQAVTAVAARLADDLLDALRTTLLPSLRAGTAAGEPDASLSERVGEVFRDLKGPVVEAVADRHLIVSYGRGCLASWRALDVERIAWVLGDEARCPERRCRANATEGPVAPGATFSSGDALPPVHDGCTCVLEPA